MTPTVDFLLINVVAYLWYTNNCQFLTFTESYFFICIFFFYKSVFYLYNIHYSILMDTS